MSVFVQTIVFEEENNFSRLFLAARVSPPLIRLLQFGLV